MMKFAAFGAIALALAKLAGLGVETDPKSPDFLKVKAGNTRFDIFGGLLQPMRLMIRILGLGKNAIVAGDGMKDNPLDLIYRFISYKLSPLVQLPIEFLRGKTAVGEKRTPAQSLARLPIPFWAETTMEAYLNDGANMAIAAGTGEFFGLSVGSYQKKKTKQYIWGSR